MSLTTLLTGALTTGASSSVDFGRPMPAVAFQFLLGTTGIGVLGAKPTLVSIDIEQSLNGTNWIKTDNIPLTGDCITTKITQPAQYLRLNVLSQTGGLLPTLLALVEPVG